MLDGKKTIGFAIMGVFGWLGWSDFITMSELFEGIAAWITLIGLGGTIWGRVVAKVKVGGGSLK